MRIRPPARAPPRSRELRGGAQASCRNGHRGGRGGRLPSSGELGPRAAGRPWRPAADTGSPSVAAASCRPGVKLARGAPSAGPEPSRRGRGSCSAESGRLHRDRARSGDPAGSPASGVDSGCALRVPPQSCCPPLAEPEVGEVGDVVAEEGRPHLQPDAGEGAVPSAGGLRRDAPAAPPPRPEAFSTVSWGAGSGWCSGRVDVCVRFLTRVSWAM